MFLVLMVNEEMDLHWDGTSGTVQLIWEKGQSGACPVFETYVDAYEAAEGDEELIIELEPIPE